MKKYNSLLEADVAWIAGTDQGKRFFRHLMDVCGMERCSIVLSRIDDEVNVRATINNEALRGLYLDLRKLLPFADRVQIENVDPEVPKAEEQQSKGKSKKQENKQWQRQDTTDMLHRERLQTGQASQTSGSKVELIDDSISEA